MKKSLVPIIDSRAGNPKMSMIDGAILKLRQARDTLRRAGADKAATAVARSLKSAEGARRNAEAHASEQKFRVHVHYQTACGNPGAAVIDVTARDENAAIDRANRYVRARRKGCKIVGGDLEPIPAGDRL